MKPNFALIFLTLLAGITSCPAYTVFVGAFKDQEQLLDRAKWAYVADNCDGYYNHPDGLRKMDLPQRQKIAALFKNKLVLMEANRNTGLNPWANDPSPTDPKALSLKAAGFTPYAAIIAASNIPTAVWQPLATQYQAHGFANCFIMTGISVGKKGLGWSDPMNDQTRTLIQDPLSAGSGVDQPVNLFLGEPKWAKSTEEEIGWTHQHGKKFVYLISPNSVGPDFLKDSQLTVRALEAAGQSPDIYGVEYYRAGYDMTPETVPDSQGKPVPANTVTGIAYWLLKHRDGTPDFADLWLRDEQGQVCGRSVIDPQGTAEPRVVRIDPGHAARMSFTVKVTSHDAAIDYAPVVQAKIAGAAQGWNVTFAADGRDVTGAVLKDGYAFVGDRILLPGTTRELTMTLERNPAATNGGDAGLELSLRANPASATVRDVVRMTLKSAATPSVLAATSRP